MADANHTALRKNSPQNQTRIGDRFGRLTVVGFVMRTRRSPIERRETYLQLQCDCGNMTEARLSDVRGRTKSCGCYSRDLTIARSKTHGLTDSPTYISWHQMRMRCTNPNDPYYHRYGGRGISVCERWAKFENFLADMGVRPTGLSIDRINTDGNYEPGNCRWATAKEQAQNRKPRGKRK